MKRCHRTPSTHAPFSSFKMTAGQHSNMFSLTELLAHPTISMLSMLSFTSKCICGVKWHRSPTYIIPFRTKPVLFMDSHDLFGSYFHDHSTCVRDIDPLEKLHCRDFPSTALNTQASCKTQGFTNLNQCLSVMHHWLRFKWQEPAVVEEERNILRSTLEMVMWYLFFKPKSLRTSVTEFFALLSRIVKGRTACRWYFIVKKRHEIAVEQLSSIDPGPRLESHLR